jgi:excisionase family DNA binding protein
MQTYTTGRAARELGVPQSVLRALCQAGVIAARTTGGGHWRIPRGEMERLRRDGVPELPSIPTEESAAGPVPMSANARAHPALLAEPSQEAIGAADQVVVLENQVKSLELKRAKEKQLDWFRERQRSQAASQAQHQKRALELRASQLRREWITQWLAYAIECLPKDAPADIALDVRANIEQTLADFDPSQPHHVVERLIHGDVEKALRPWRRGKEIEKAIQDARNRLPAFAQGLLSSPSEWDTLAMRAASEAVAKLSPDCSFAEIRAVCADAGEQVRLKYERRRAEEAHQRACALIVEWVFDGEEARAAVRDALRALPVGATSTDLEKARDKALSPFRAAKKAASDADSFLSHVQTYIEKLGNEATGEWDLGTWSERWDLAEKIKKEIRPKLIRALLRGELADDEIREFVEETVNDELDL